MAIIPLQPTKFILAVKIRIGIISQVVTISQREKVGKTFHDIREKDCCL